MSTKWMLREFELSVFPKGPLDQFSDDPLPLEAYARDIHTLIHSCSCDESEGGLRLHDMEANVRYEWELLEGGEGFVAQTDGDPHPREAGRMVLFQPPDLTKTEEEKLVAKLMVRAYHDDADKQPDHPPLTAQIEIRVRRSITHNGKMVESSAEFTDPGDVDDKYHYQIVVTCDPPVKNTPPPEVLGCNPVAEWSSGQPAKITLGAEPGEIVYGDFVKLRADAGDVDALTLRVEPKSEECVVPQPQTMELDDPVMIIWQATAGSFSRGDRGKEVLWLAPTQSGSVRFSLTTMQSGFQFADPEQTAHFMLLVRKLGLGIVKTPKDWLPEATAKKLEPPVRTYVCRDGKWTLPGRRKHIRYKLLKVSREPGVCMNYPQFGNTNPDLFFYEEEMKDDYFFKIDRTQKKDCPTEILKMDDNPRHDKHYLIAVSMKRTSDSAPVIRCEDYGAIARFRADANCCAWIPPLDKKDDAYKDCSEGSIDIIIPRDENGNDIADSARQDAGGANADLDDDPTPQGNGDGDGLTNYEEYRGFVILGETRKQKFSGRKSRTIVIGRPKEHIRTDTRRKDVFIYDEDGIGTGFLNATGLDIHLLYQSELFKSIDTRMINFNHGRHFGGEQHGLWLRDANLSGSYGRACGGENGTPKNKTHVCIDVFNNTYHEHPNRLANTVAHELCHGLNIWHHGPVQKLEIELDEYDKEKILVNEKGSCTSGDVNCFIRYDQYADWWVHKSPPCVHSYVDLVKNADGKYDHKWKDAPGTTLCETLEGTGLNDCGAGHQNPVADDRGDCRSRLKVKDW